MKKMFVLIALLAIIAAPALAQGENLLVNGGFETGDLEGWTEWGAAWGGPYNVAVQSDVVNSGAFALNLNTHNGSFGVVQGIQVEVGKIYEISGYWQGTGSQHWIEVLMFNNDNRPIVDQLDGPDKNAVLTKTDGFGMNTAPFTGFEAISAGRWFTDGMHRVRVRATTDIMYVGLKSGTVANVPLGVNSYFDDFTVREVPEPSSLLALASGISALGFGLRRKIR